MGDRPVIRIDEVARALASVYYAVTHPEETVARINDVQWKIWAAVRMSEMNRALRQRSYSPERDYFYGLRRTGE